MKKEKTKKLAVLKIMINIFWTIIIGYFLIASEFFKTNPWYLLIIYTIMSILLLTALWFLVKIIVHGSKKIAKNVPKTISSKHQIKNTRIRGRR